MLYTYVKLEYGLLSYFSVIECTIGEVASIISIGHSNPNLSAGNSSLDMEEFPDLYSSLINLPYVINWYL